MTTQTSEHVDAVVVGAGFAGMYALHRLREDLGLSVVAIERGDDVGGTWYWNRYPGARCDGESIFYSYSFDSALQESWTWTERYATQPEILAYASHVADRLDLRRDIRFDTTVFGARFNESDNRWTVSTSSGELTAKYFITAIGCLSTSRIPDIDGLSDYTGEIYHTGRWPHDGVDFTGKRVAMIGTGSSGIQLLPSIAPACEHVTVFQRTPNFSIPARNSPLGPDKLNLVRTVYPTLREAARMSAAGQLVAPPISSALDDPTRVSKELDRRWVEGGGGFMTAFTDTMVSEDANKITADYVRARIRDIVEDPTTADLLSPTDHPIGAKRICIDTNYFATYNRDNVDLVDVSVNPIDKITARGIEVAGVEYEVDAIVFATGFDAMTGPFQKMDIRGRGEVSLAESWSAGPRTYLGLSVHGFPNMFMITGPGSPSVLSNMITSIEQHVDWITDYLRFLDTAGIATTETSLAAQDSWVEEVNAVAASTLFVKGKSWYLGANVPGKPRVFMPYAGGVGTYRQQCDLVTAKGYAGFEHSWPTATPADESTAVAAPAVPASMAGAVAAGS